MALVLESKEVISMFAGTMVGIVLGVIVGGTLLFVGLYLFFKPLDDKTLAPYQLVPL
jgi:hypothetical protein